MTNYNNISVLVVEDEPIIAMLIEDMITDLGCRCCSIAGTVSDAMSMAEASTPDFAILDLNLGGQSSYPVAHKLLERQIPFVFLSGYGGKALDPAFAGVKSLQKPFQPNDIENALKAVFPELGKNLAAV